MRVHGLSRRRPPTNACRRTPVLRPVASAATHDIAHARPGRRATVGATPRDAQTRVSRSTRRSRTANIGMPRSRRRRVPSRSAARGVRVGRVARCARTQAVRRGSRAVLACAPPRKRRAVAWHHARVDPGRRRAAVLLSRRVPREIGSASSSAPRAGAARLPRGEIFSGDATGRGRGRQIEHPRRGSRQSSCAAVLAATPTRACRGRRPACHRTREPQAPLRSVTTRPVAGEHHEAS